MLLAIFAAPLVRLGVWGGCKPAAVNGELSTTMRGIGGAVVAPWRQPHPQLGGKCRMKTGFWFLASIDDQMCTLMKKLSKFSFYVLIFCCFVSKNKLQSNLMKKNHQKVLNNVLKWSIRLSVICPDHLGKSETFQWWRCSFLTPAARTSACTVLHVVFNKYWLLTEKVSDRVDWVESDE